MHGFYGRGMKVDLSNEQVEIESIGEDLLTQYLGGKGLAAYLLSEFNPAGVDPLAPENRLLFLTGPFAGSAVWGSCRYGVYTKSPQTGLWAESYSGGKTPEAIDAAGFDAILIQGRARKPSVLVVHPEGVEFHAAEDLWGMETYEAEQAVNERFGLPQYRKKGAVVIGPAGENLVRFAVIANDSWRCAGRTGVGTVIGSKNLKAILFQGDRQRSWFDEKGLKEFTKTFLHTFKGHAATHAYRTWGTPMLVKTTNGIGAFPTRYWQEGTCRHWEKISGEALVSRCSVKPHSCPKCFMGCGRLSTVREGRHAGLTLEGPEYETIYAFGGLCLIEDIEEILYLNDICDRLGMDTITAGNLCGLTIEAVRRGKADYRIDYGEADAIAGLLTRIAQRRGIGEILAQGIRFAAKEWDMEDMAVHVKGLEPAGYDPRVLKGMGLAYGTSDRGACHLRATFYKAELSGMIAPEQIAGKAELFLEFEDRLTIFDALILCRFYRDFYAWDKLGEALHLVTGLDGREQELKRKARAIADLIRRFNVREGMKPEDDLLPKALHRGLKDSGKVITEEELHMLLKDYYALHGWDEEGLPGA